MNTTLVFFLWPFISHGHFTSTGLSTDTPLLSALKD